MQYKTVILDVLREAETWGDSAVKARVYKNSYTAPGGWGEDSHMKQTGMLLVSLVNFGFWSRLGCSG